MLPHLDGDSDDGVPPLTGGARDAEPEDNDKDLDLEDDNNEDDEEDELKWNSGMSKCKDLFSDAEFDSAQECLDQCQAQHNFDIKVLKKRHAMDCFSFIRLVNFIRSQNPSPDAVMKMTSDAAWSDDAYMKPVLADDPMLMVDVDEDIGSCDDEDPSNVTVNDLDDMKRTLESLQRQLQVKSEQLEAAVEDMDKMKRITQSLVDGPAAASTLEVERSVSGRRTENEDSNYAGSYAHFGIHHEMLSDKVRTETYRDAVAKNVDSVRGKRVLDLGCGTSILSMFCAHHGQAKQVVGVDMSSIAHQAMDIVMENKLDDTIKIVKGRLEDTDLKSQVGFEKFDVLISEWMGYFLLFEGMLDSVMKARDTYLTSKQALILPNRCTMHLVGVCDKDRYAQTAGYFEDVYGFKMTCLRDPLIKEASVEIVPSSKMITSSAQIHHLDMNKCTLADTEFKSEFELTVNETGMVTSIAGYFDTFFDDPCLKNPVMFSTGPAATPTHWKQTVFYLREPLSVSKGQVIKGKISVVRPDQDIRALRVKLALDGHKSQTFHVE